MDNEYAIEIDNLSKKYDGFALKDVSIKLQKGTIMGFIGQNGAGKTTTIKSILNLIPVDTGTIRILGLDHIKDENKIKEQTAVIFDAMPFHDSITARQLGKIMKGMYKSFDSEKYAGYIERFSLPFNKKIGQFSKGMKMKLQIAAALSRDVKLLIMDEATAGLDPVVRNEMLNVFMEFMQDEDHSIFMSSHITSDLEKIADALTFIHNGKVILSGLKDDILAAHGVIKCCREDVAAIDDGDIIGIHLTDYNAEVMVSDKDGCIRKYPDMIMDGTTLDEILLFYVKAMTNGKKEWSY